MNCPCCKDTIGSYWGVQYCVWVNKAWSDWTGPLGIYTFDKLKDALGEMTTIFDGRPIVFSTREIASDMIKGMSGDNIRYRVIKVNECGKIKHNNP